MDAHEVNSLREEITAVLAAAKARDQVVIRLESPGGWFTVTGWRSSCSCATSRSR
jgi:ClpP class serine protease